MQIAHLYLKQSSSGSKVNWKATVTGNCHAGFGKGRFETCCKVTRGPPTSSEAQCCDSKYDPVADFVPPTLHGDRLNDAMIRDTLLGHRA